MGPLIGKGNTAEIFDIGDNKVVKLFKPGYPFGGVLKEYENARLLESLGLPIAKSHGLIETSNRHGIIYDRIRGESMLESVIETGNWEKYAVDLAILHKRILSHQVPYARSLKTRLRHNIDRVEALGARAKAALLKVLDSLPCGNCLCRGDFHFDNIIVSQREHKESISSSITWS